MENTQSCCNIR